MFASGFTISVTAGAGGVTSVDAASKGPTQMEMYPNPTEQGVVNLSSVNGAEKGRVELELLGITGERRLPFLVSRASGLQTMPVDIHDLESGIYLVRLTQGASVTTQKLVVR